MLILLPIILLFLTAVGMAVLAQFQPRFSYHWLIASSGAALAWLATLALPFDLPHSVVLVNWQPSIFFVESPALLVDAVSWPFMLALTTLAVAVILTDVGRASTVGWQTWAGSLAMMIVGLLSVIAGNLLTLVLVWSVIDILELTILLPRRPEPDVRQGLIVYFSFSILGTMLVLLGDLWARSAGAALNFTSIPPNIMGILFLGIGLRLGVLPLHVPFVREPNLRRGLGTVVRLVPVAASMVLLTRIAAAGGEPQYGGVILVFLLFSAAYGAVAWARMPNELVGRPYWVLVLASFAFVSAVRGLPSATLAWSLALLFAGGSLFLFSETDNRLIWLPLLGVASIIALPFTPTYAGSALFTDGFQLFMYLFFPVWGILLAGAVRHVIRHRPPFQVGPARWIALIYPLGLSILPITHWLLGIFYLPSAPISSFWPGLVVLGFAALGAVLFSRGINISSEIFKGLDTVFSFRWLYALLGGLYTFFTRIIKSLTSVLEGDGSVLWSFLLAILLVSLLTQLSGGAP